MEDTHILVIDNSNLGRGNFCHPIHKSVKTPFTDDDRKCKTIFGSVISKRESTFGDLGTIFDRFNNHKTIRLMEKEPVTVQFKLACLLLNINRLINMERDK